MQYNSKSANLFIEEQIDSSVIPNLSKFIQIPNLSRFYDNNWATNGLLQEAAHHIKTWVQTLQIQGLKAEILKQKDLSPLIYIEIEGQKQQKTVLYYGHFDKQPHMSGWDQGKAATKPVIIDNKLYGRGGADDGYSTYSSLLAVKAVQKQGIALPRIIMIAQGDEQSGGHMDIYLKLLKERMGKVDIVFCLDSSTIDYQRFWITKSIRGYVDFQVTINTIREGIHSGTASGIVPSTFRIANLLLDRLQNLQTGKINKYFQSNIPSEIYEQLHKNCKNFGLSKIQQQQKIEGLRYVSENMLDLYLNSAWRPQMTVIGLSGLPQTSIAGNVMLPEMKFKVNIRVPPIFDISRSKQFIQNLLSKDTPFNCKVTVSKFQAQGGWYGKKYESWFQQILTESSKNIFGYDTFSICQGGSIPIIGTLGKFYKDAQIVVTGVLGPNSNAHGPNQFLHIPYTKKQHMLWPKFWPNIRYPLNDKKLKVYQLKLIDSFVINNDL